MRLNKVTITGADDSIKVSDLVELSKKYPFVEWGILLSANRIGTPRYPSAEWLKELYSTAKSERIKLSAHLCGSYASGVLSGTFSPLAGISNATGIQTYMEIFDRYQVNFQANKYLDKILSLNDIIGKWPRVNFIIQANEINESVVQDIISKGFPNASFLFDASRGNGELPSEYRKPFEGFYCGYAGGLTPNNVESELEKIRGIVGENKFWIDTESGVRSDEGKKFDLENVVAFLEEIIDYVHADIEEPKKSRQEVEDLKRNWLRDPCWDIETTEGFEDYFVELKEFQQKSEKEWKESENKRLKEKGLRLGIPERLDLVRHLEYLENRIQKLEEQKH